MEGRDRKKQRNRCKMSGSIKGSRQDGMHQDEERKKKRQERVDMLYRCLLPQTEKGDGRGGRNDAVESHLT